MNLPPITPAPNWINHAFYITYVPDAVAMRAVPRMVAALVLIEQIAAQGGKLDDIRTAARAALYQAGATE